MKIRIRDAETRETLHVIHIDADDDRRDDIVKQVVVGFDGRNVIVDDSDEDEDDAPEIRTVSEHRTVADDAAAADATTRPARAHVEEPMGSLTGDGHPVDASPGIPAEGTTT